MVVPQRDGAADMAAFMHAANERARNRHGIVLRPVAARMRDEFFFDVKARFTAARLIKLLPADLDHDLKAAFA
jgi:hypothetical protein